MTDELELLRDFVRAYVAERRVYAEWSGPMRERLDRGDRSMPSDEFIKKQQLLSGILKDRQEELTRAVDRVREVAPELFND